MSEAGSTPTPLDALLAQRAWVGALARRLVSDADRADEIEQRTWLAAMERPPAHVDSPRGWLATALRNAARKLGRADARRSRREAEARVREPQRSPADLVAETELQQRVGRMVLELEEPYRETVLLRYVEGLEPVEIARRQGVPPGTVRTRLHRAIARLRERLDDEHRGNRATWTAAVLLWCGGPMTRPTGVPATGSLLGGVSMAAANKAALASVALALLALGGSVVLNATRSDGDRAVVVAPTSDAPETTRSAKRLRTAPAPHDVNGDLPAPVDLSAVDRERDLTGVVVRTDGTSVAGAEIRSILHPHRLANLGEPQWVRFESAGPTTRTSVDGTFRLTLAPGEVVTLRVVAAGLPVREFYSRTAGGRVRLVLDDGVRLRLTAVTAAGAPVVGARLAVGTGEKNEMGGTRVETTTDSQGGAVVEGLAGGGSAWVQTLDALHGANTFWNLPLPASGEVEHRLEFGPFRTLRGHVTDAATGRAIGGARVGMGPSLDHAVTTQADGSYELPGWTGVLAVRVTFAADGFMRHEVDVGGQSTIDVALRRGFSVRGRAVAADEAAVRDALVSAAAIRDERGQSNMTHGNAITGPDGCFLVEGLDPEMTHRLVIAAAGRARSVSLLAPRPAGETVDVGDVRLGAPHVLAGRLVDAAGRGIEGATVELQGPGERSDWDSTLSGLRVFRRTDDLGRFRFGDLPPGSYVLQEYAFDGPTVETPVSVPEQGDVTEIVVQGAPSRVLTVRVRDESGRAVVGAQVEAWGESTRSPRAETDVDGTARVRVAKGVRWMSVTAAPTATRVLLRTSMEIQDSEDEMHVVLREGASIRVRLLGPDDVPIAHAAVSAGYGRGGLARAVTDEEGRAVIVLPRATSYEVVFEDHAAGLFASASRVNDGADLTLRPTRIPRDRTLRVRLLRPDGGPAANEPVSVHAPMGGKERKTVRTDASGIAAFEGLPARALTASSWMGEFAPAVGVTVVPAGQTIELRQREWAFIRGRCLDASGQPVAASLELADQDTEQMILSAPGSSSSPTTGAFEIHVPAGEPGPFRIVADTENPRRRAHADVPATGVAEVIVRFDR